MPDRFHFETTADGSLSLRFRESTGGLTAQFSEAMHSLKGAFSETVYIYGTAIKKALDSGFEPAFFSLGLGLGYNEILTTALLEAHNLPRNEYIESFECDADLREFFSAWLHGRSAPGSFAAAYDGILQRIAAEYALTSTVVKSRLRIAHTDGRLLLRGALTPSTTFSTRFSCFLFDAFSAKTSPELWSEEFLGHLLATTALPGAVLSTYACTGNLKRALRAAGFALQIREGFASKRDCTFAVRTPTGNEQTPTSDERAP